MTPRAAMSGADALKNQKLAPALARASAALRLVLQPITPVNKDKIRAKVYWSRNSTNTIQLS